MTQISQKYVLRFEQEILPLLNEGQAKAVGLIEGPVMVIAGPGTGKTQLLAARIANILHQTDTDPGAILCLTYTEAGTTAMRRRLIEFMGPEGYRIPVNTFHGFCNTVIQENPGLFGGYRDLYAITELDQRTLMKHLLDELPADHRLKRLKGDFYNDVSRLLGLFDTMKREAFSPEDISTAIDRYLEELPQRPGFFYTRKYKEFNAGDPKAAAIEEETRRMDDTRAAAFLLTEWQSRMQAAGWYDFNDMLRWVHDAFDSDEDLLRRYQERYLYMLVDEYQDTSGLQNRILYQLAGFWSDPNVFVVGDDDQAIYRFQGASMANILEFYERFRPQTVMLADNYRSTQVILDSAAALIDQNQLRLNKVLDLEKRLIARGAGDSVPSLPPRLLEFDASTSEEYFVASEIRNHLDRGVPAADIAVLYRNHAHAENLIRLCQQWGIPVNQQRKENILQDPFILGLLDVLRYLAGELHEPFSQEGLLVRILHFRYFGIPPLDIARLMHFMRVRQDQGGSSQAFRSPLRWRELITNRDLLRDAGVTDPSIILATAENLEFWLKQSHEWTVQTLFEKVLTRGGVLSTILSDPQKRRLLEMVTTFFDFVKSVTAADPTVGLDAVLDMVDEMIAGNIALPYVYHIGDPNGVPFSTVHSAKGLEWRKVFMIACSAKNWSGKSSNRGYKLPDTILPGAADEAQQAEEDERRLFFVGMTRAKEELCISYAKDQRNARTSRTSTQDLACKFMMELQDFAGLTIESVAIGETNKEIVLESLLHPLDINPGQLEEAWIREQVDGFVMSVTALNKYLSCPRAFYYENILRVPAARNMYMGYGSAVHGALEQLFTSNPALDGDVAAQLVAFFEKSLYHYRSHFTDVEYRNTLEHGRKQLPGYVEDLLPVWQQPEKVHIEKNIRNVEWEGYPIKGKLDKIEEYPDGVSIVDYKTGNPERGIRSLSPPDPSDPEDPGGDYWRQIVFYEMLVRADKGTGWKVKNGVMEFVEPMRNGRYVRRQLEVSDEDLQKVTAQMAFAYEGIRRMEFAKGCHSSGCAWCELMDRHILPESLTPGGADYDQSDDEG